MWKFNFIDDDYVEKIDWPNSFACPDHIEKFGWYKYDEPQAEHKGHILKTTSTLLHYNIHHEKDCEIRWNKEKYEFPSGRIAKRIQKLDKYQEEFAYRWRGQPTGRVEYKTRYRWVWDYEWRCLTTDEAISLWEIWFPDAMIQSHPYLWNLPRRE